MGKALGCDRDRGGAKQASVGKAKASGCDEVLVFDVDSLASDVVRIIDGKKVDVVYDPLGRISFQASLDCLRPRGLMVSFGASSGAPSPVELSTLNAKGSLFLTRPLLAAHTATDVEYQERALDVLAALDAGIIKPRIWGELLASRHSIGACRPGVGAFIGSNHSKTMNP